MINITKVGGKDQRIIMSEPLTIQWVVLVFLIILILGQTMRIYCMLHITSYHYHPLVDIHSYQCYFNMLCH